MNIFCFTGALGQDVDVRVTAGGTSVASFSVAVNSGYGDNKKTTWTKCALFGKRAEGGLIPYLVKGQKVAVSGELSTNEWTTQDGQNRTDIQVRVNELDLIGEKKSGGVAQANQPAPAESGFEDEIPF